MEIKITKPGIFGANGEIAVGTILNVEKEPVQWRGRYEIVSNERMAVTNPAEGAVAQGKDVEPTAEERQALLKAAALQMGVDDFNDSGTPDVRALNAELSDDAKPFSAAERDQLWPGIAEAVKVEREA